MLKHRMVIIFLLTHLHYVAGNDSVQEMYKCGDCKPPREQKHTNSQETARVVVANFLTMLAQLLMMAQNPKDQQIFTASIMGIAQGLGNIALEASKSQKISDELIYTTISKEPYLKNDPLPEEIHALYAKYAEHFDMLSD